MLVRERTDKQQLRTNCTFFKKTSYTTNILEVEDGSAILHADVVVGYATFP